MNRAHTSLSAVVVLLVYVSVTVQGGGIAHRFGDSGVVQLWKDGAKIISEVGIGIWKQGKFYFQSSSRARGANDYFIVALRVGKDTVRVYEKLVRSADGLILFYELERIPEAAKWALLVRFEPELAGTEVVVGSRKSVLPFRTPRNPRFLVGKSRSVQLLLPSGVLSILPRGGEFVFQDRRAWNERGYELLIYPGEQRSVPEGWGEVAVRFRDGEPSSRPMIIRCRQNSRTIPAYGRLLVEAEVWSQAQNPYDPKSIRMLGQFTLPSGGREVVSGFLYRDYERELVGEQERLNPLPWPRWRLLYCPREVGEYSYKVWLREGEHFSQVAVGSFECKPSRNRGLARVNPADRRFFQFETGAPLFLIGHNACWSLKGGTFYYEELFSKMRRLGENFTRIWFCSWGLRFEGSTLDNYRLDTAWQFDKILQFAEQNRIYIMLCIDNFHDFSYWDKEKFIPYYRSNGGPCTSAEDFFTNTVAMEHYKRKLRYIVSRWGAYVNLFAYELFNEIDLTFGRRSGSLVEWTKEMARYLKSLDPHHMVTISHGTEGAWDALWELDEIDFVPAHIYVPRAFLATKPEEIDEAVLVLRRGQEYAKYGKPYFISEFGYGGEEDYLPLHEDDKKGTALHNALWASSLSGSAGTPMNWWWDSYLEPLGLLKHYSAFSRFFAQTDTTGWGTARDPGTGRYRVVALKSSTEVLLWIQCRGNGWYLRYIRGTLPVKLTGGRIILRGLQNGYYVMEWWDTYTGRRIEEATVNVTDRSLTLSIPTGYTDIACRVKKY